jgi:alkanesulfonate monooxygenase SsuD/methylene tetrahydromethanopterin reductase-like flavin-dependent oxidoreductase (luciferase family)
MPKFGLFLSNYGDAITPGNLIELAREAEAHGWNGFFLWDQMLAARTQKSNVVDPWVALAGMAAHTERIRLGTMVTPIARRRPWKLARETVTLDHLSNGRLILGVGLGFPPHADFELFGEVIDDRIRAERLDEGLAILAGLWSGRPFEFHGAHYNLGNIRFRPAPIQQPRIPIWVGGYWPNKAPFRRAARWDGAFPLKSGGGLKGKDLRHIMDYIRQFRSVDESEASFDLVTSGTTPGDDPRKAQNKVQPLVDNGLTWWLESIYLHRNDQEAMLARVRQGPPRY